jgi:hypothetical protein
VKTPEQIRAFVQLYIWERCVHDTNKQLGIATWDIFIEAVIYVEAA